MCLVPCACADGARHRKEQWHRIALCRPSSIIKKKTNMNDYIIQRIKSAARITDVVGTFYTLRRSGTEWTCLCPFHDDRHLGSFKVSAAKNLYKCFACGAGGDAADFIMRHERLSYPDALRWLGRQYGIDPDDGRHVRPDSASCRPAPRPLPAPLPTLFLPDRLVAASESSTDNALGRYLRQLPWSQEQAARIASVFEDYHLGTSSEGHTIFWLLDENGNTRTGKMMHYRADGHRDKQRPGSVSWVHSRLQKSGHYNPKAFEVRQVLFGLHLLRRYPQAEVHIVESEKTALVCAICFGHPDRHVWMATGGKENLTATRLRPLMEAHRTVALHPDRDAVGDWSERCRRLGYARAYINNDLMEHHWTPEDGEKADLADVLTRLLTQP